MTKRERERETEISRPYSFKLTLLKSEEHNLEMGKGIWGIEKRQIGQQEIKKKKKTLILLHYRRNCKSKLLTEVYGQVYTARFKLVTFDVQVDD